MGYDHIRSILGTRVEVWAVKRLARRAALVIQDRFHGPIPARAGQPLRYFSRCWCLWAYPRSRGTTDGVANDLNFVLGLSPLARGNLGLVLLGCGFRGPIPARAGQPRQGAGSCSATRAYPRSRGATWCGHAASLCSCGLSPLARGNHGQALVAGCSDGPIPARAGQPPRWSQGSGPGWAYPRSRGATL